MKLKVNNIKKYYDANLVINSSTFEINKGQIVALVGRNGTGKTTTLKLIAQILNPTEGEVFIDDKSVFENRELLQNIVFIPDNYNMFTMSSIKNIMSYYKYAYPNFDEELFRASLESFDFKISKTMRQFSKGQKAIVATLLGIATNAQFMLLDEPLDGLDIIIRKKITNYLIEEVEKGRSVLITSHQLLDLEAISDRFLIFNDEHTIIEQTDSRNITYKFQLAFNDGILPEILENDQNLRIVDVVGRIFTIVVKGDRAEWLEKISKTNPLVLDELNINLTDSFIMETTRKGDEF